MCEISASTVFFSSLSTISFGFSSSGSWIPSSIEGLNKKFKHLHSSIKAWAYYLLDGGLVSLGRPEPTSFTMPLDGTALRAL